MILTNKLLPVALVAALIGGSVGAFVMHSRNQTAEASTATAPATTTQAQDASYDANAAPKEQYIPAEFNSAPEQNAYKAGFTDGFRACESGAAGNRVATTSTYAQPRVTYRNTVARSTSPRRVYYDYQQPHGRTFWQKHRDKLTLAMGTGGGAILGGLIGGKRGAGIGALAGAGGSALYTYKLRNRSRRY